MDLADALSEEVLFLEDSEGEAAPEGFEEAPLAVHRLGPFGRVDAEELRDGRVGKVQIMQIERGLRRHIADGTVGGAAASVAPLQHPFQDAQVFAVAGPEELAVVASAEPVDAEDLRR